MVFSKCEAIEAALTPIIGLRGVQALHRRSLHLAARSHAWLGSCLAGRAGLAGPCAPEKPAVCADQARRAASGGAAFLQAFYGLLCSLVGHSLTERLLRTVWIDFMGASPAQDD